MILLYIRQFLLEITYLLFNYLVPNQSKGQDINDLVV